MTPQENILKYNDLNWEYDKDDQRFGKRALVKFDNGFGASIVDGPYSYGLELAVMGNTDEEDWGLVYYTDITNDVVGWNTPEGITELLVRISKLDEKGCESEGTGSPEDTHTDEIRMKKLSIILSTPERE